MQQDANAGAYYKAMCDPSTALIDMPLAGLLLQPFGRLNWSNGCCDTPKECTNNHLWLQRH